MSPPAHIAALIVAAGFGIAAGITVLYNFLTDLNYEEVHQGNSHLSSSRPRRSSSSSPDRLSSPKRRSPRAISPPRVTVTPSTSQAALTSRSSDGDHRRPGEVANCQICKESMRKRTIELNCSHIFHDECYTIWRYNVVMQNPQAKLCPSC